ncbi:MAG TPA: MobF family relaxase [Acidimicrobiales bacterium]
MLVLKPVGDRVAGYYLKQGPGEWLGRGSDRLGLHGGIEAAAMTAVLRGCDPSRGVYLPRVKSPRRRAGWDLVFAAPKSLSLVSATSSGTASDLEPSIGFAHRCAVRGAVEHLERESGKEIVGAAFDHLHNAGGEPHLHTHVLVANLAPTAAGWAALGTWLHREELAAVYHLGLRYHLDRTGLQLDWRIRSNGLPDLAVVPRAAVRAASTRSHESRGGAGWAGRNGPPRAWGAAVLHAGWGSSHASRAAHESMGPRSSVTPGAASLEARVSARLLTRGSTFTKRDVIAALAAASQAGFDAEAATSWADAFFNASSPIGSDVGADRRTTTRAVDADRRLAALIERRAERRAQGVAAGDLETAAQLDPTLSSRSRETVRSLVGNEGVVLLAAGPGRSNFVADAAIGAACASVWESHGTTVGVAARSAAESARWAALSGIEAFHPSVRPDVLIVDQADRRPPGELMALLSAAPEAKVVFVEGGTLPRTRVDGSLGYSQTTTALTRLDPGPAPEWRALPDVPLAGALTGVAAGKLLDHWAQSFGVARTENPTMVGLGVPETLALNDAARRHLLDTGRLDGPSIQSRGRAFQTGDRVVAIRGAGAGLPAGTVGTIVEVDPKRRSAMISWTDRATEMKRDQLGTIGHAYAATPRLASRMEGPVFVLGRAEGLGIERSRVAAQISVERRGPALERERHRVIVGREL